MLSFQATTSLSQEHGHLTVMAVVLFHSHYAWVLSSLSPNCAFDGNQMGNFHFVDSLIGVP